MNKRIAILGSTSHIAKGLIENFCRDEEVKLFLFARNIAKADDFLRDIGCRGAGKIRGLDKFGKEKYDAVINCVGIGDSAALKEASVSVFELTEKYDNLIIEYLKKNRKSVYINFSSGAVYGEAFDAAADLSSRNCVSVNTLGPSSYYSIAKLNSEAKHRSYPGLKITDLRVFAYFSRFIDLNSKYLITEIVNCIIDNKVFKTGNNNIVRDFSGSEDLFSLVCACIKYGGNAAYDLYSKKAASKFDILKSFHNKFGLKYKISGRAVSPSATGAKSVYCSKNKLAGEIGFKPKYTSLELLEIETERVLENRRG